MSTSRSSSSSPTNKTLALSVGASIALSCGYYLFNRHKARQPRKSLKDLQGNFYGTGSDVCRLYADKIPGKVVLITGTTSGLGAHTAKLLGIHGAFVIMGIRRPEDVQDLVQEIQQAGGTAVALPLDLASFASVQEFAQKVKDTLQKHNLAHLQLLIHNAGVSFIDGTSKDGYQLVWQVNALAPALLTELVLPMLNPKDSRILHISSEMHKMCGGLFFGSKSIVDKYCPPNPKKGSASADYALSKACQILMATQLNHARKIRAFAIEPGLVRTQIGRHVPAQWALELEYLLLGPFFLRTVDQGCSSTLFCALAPMEVLNGPGNDGNKETPFYYANCQPKKPKAVCLDAEEAQRLQDLYKKCWKDFL